MKRAAVIIGVNQTGNLPKLQAAVSSAHKMKKWADSQGFNPATVLTDENGPLTIQSVKIAMNEILKKGTVEQLLVYFSGHGVNIRRGEYWLLSGAPVDIDEAVNVEGSAVLARQAGISHVVFVSDACRTAAEGIQAQAVEGSNIFQNFDNAGQEKPVDLFFATTLGSPSYEIKDPLAAATQYDALYTNTLVDALEGRLPPCIERLEENGAFFDVVRPWPLRSCLETELPRRMTAAKVALSVFQVPDARITSPPATWLARFKSPPGAPPPPPTPSPTPAPISPVRGIVSVRPESVFLDRRIAAIEVGMGPALAQSVGQLIITESRARSTPFGRSHFESRCGFKVRGANLVEAYHPSRQISVDGPDSVAVFGPNPSGGYPNEPASVVLRFDNDKGAILPAIPEFVTGLTFEEGELVDVVYEPADTSSRWREYEARAVEIRKLRGRIAAAARFGVFRLEGENALQLARQMQNAKRVDPTIALYAAYAYDSLQQTNRIRDMQNHLAEDLKMRFFDIALLAGALDERTPGKIEDIFPSMPMLSQGWALLSAHHLAQPFLKSLPRHLESSLWTLFNATGIEKLKSALQSGEIH